MVSVTAVLEKLKFLGKAGNFVITTGSKYGIT